MSGHTLASAPDANGDYPRVRCSCGGYDKDCWPPLPADSAVALHAAHADGRLPTDDEAARWHAERTVKVEEGL